LRLRLSADTKEAVDNERASSNFLIFYTSWVVYYISLRTTRLQKP